MKNITDIRHDLLELFDGLRDGRVDPRSAIVINNTAGKIIGTAKAQLGYHQLRGEKPSIPFLGGNTKIEK